MRMTNTHSFRIGAATHTAKMGISDDEISNLLMIEMKKE
jgi:hypothetical protein